MSAALKLEKLTVQEYLDGETDSPIKHEYVAGHVYAMAGGSNRHNRIATNVLGLLFQQLIKHPCNVYNSDTKVRIEERSFTRFYYPDAMVVCDENPDTDPFQDKPVILIEVLSKSTRRIDQGEKLDAYRQLDSLKTYVILEQDAIFATVYQRSGDDWDQIEATGDAAQITLPSIDATIPLASIYAGVTFNG